MRAMVFDGVQSTLRLDENKALPVPAAHQVQMRVQACGVCRTDLHVVDRDLTQPRLPLIPGHEIVGTVTALGAAVASIRIGDRVGVPWLGWTCGTCPYCLSGREKCATKPVSPATRSTAGTLTTRWRMSGSASQFHLDFRTSRRRLCSAPD